MNIVYEKTLAILSEAVAHVSDRIVLDIEELGKIKDFSKAHAVEGLLADAVLEGRVELKSSTEQAIRKKRLVMELAMVRSQHMTVKKQFDNVLAELVLLLQKENIDFVVFKGPAVASLYSCPSARTMGDIDFYVPDWDYNRALALFENTLGVTVEHCDVDKHDSFSYKGIRFEMHYQMETFGSRKHQKYFSNLVDESIKDGNLRYFMLTDGVRVPMLCPEIDLILVFKHMFNHLIGEGVGLRQVTDVAVLIHNYASILNISDLREHLRNIGYLKAFDAMVALVGRYYNVSWDAYGDYLSSKDFRMANMLMADIMKNGNFGRMDYKHRSGWKKRMETTCRFFANCMKYFCLAPWEIMCLVPKRVCISLRAH